MTAARRRLQGGEYPGVCLPFRFGKPLVGQDQRGVAVLLQSSAGDDTPNGYQRVDKARVDSGSGWFRRVASPYSNTGAAPATSSKASTSGSDSGPWYGWLATLCRLNIARVEGFDSKANSRAGRW